VNGMAADLLLWTFGLVRNCFRVLSSCGRVDAVADGMWPKCGLLRGDEVLVGGSASEVLVLAWTPGPGRLPSANRG
jgi:hypothetical protein